MVLCFATNNVNKLAEIQALIGDTIILKTLSEVGVVEELEETSGTIPGNSLQKAQYVWDNYQVDVFADDTGLEVEALDGEPGVDSAYYAGPQRSSEDNISLLLKNMEAADDRRARFLTVITLILNGETYVFEGVAEGEILEAAKGTKGFGYDPVFRPDGYEVTFAEMEMSEKNKISHRSKAFASLVTFLNSHPAQAGGE